MNIWSTFRLVPPVSLQAMAWATFSFATYLAAIEMQPVMWGRALDPLALALGVQMTLAVTSNLTSDRFAAMLNEETATFANSSIFFAIMTVLGFACVAFFATAATAAKLFILFGIAHGFSLGITALYDPQGLKFFAGGWMRSKKHVQNVVLLQSFGVVTTALTLFTVWTFAGSFAFAAMMSFGVLVLQVLTNWAIVLYLLDADEQPSDE